ncbi:hypothetical protein D9Q98_009147 [Chlorella vulgaris]|uniref:DUF3730 domain-containing protein n=1 Tax=Chlorella vulgaris TaxID=3077 RepID=A0A9D4THC8_CHLVU|nr:hypothetical protein D9Q98_009147 [Chlorella vulgaris]
MEGHHVPSAFRTKTGAIDAAAIAQSLVSGNQATVEAGVSALVHLQALPYSAAQDQLLTALSVAGRATASQLANGMLQLFRRQASLANFSLHTSVTWRTHPLSKALLSNAAAVQPLVLGVARMLTRSSTQADPPFCDLLTALRPFLSCVLLDPQLAQQQPLLPTQLHGTLTRVACCTGSPAAQVELLQLLASHLPALRLLPDSGSQLEAAASGAVCDVMELLEGCTQDPGAPIVSALAAHMLSLCHDAALAEAPALLQQLLAALSLLAAYWPQLVLPHVAGIGMLLAQLAGPSGALGSMEACAVLALLSQLLSEPPAAGPPAPDINAAGPPAGPDTCSLALLLLPLLQQLSFSGSKDVKQWAAHVLSLVQKLVQKLRGASSTSSPPADLALGSLHGPAAASQASLERLRRLWGHPLAARHWLASLQLRLARVSASGGSRSGGGGVGRDQQQLDTGTLLVTCALLQHPAEGVQRAALKAALMATAAVPLLGLSLLPLIVHQLQCQVQLFLSGQRQRPPRLLLDLLRALPAAGRHPSALPFVLRSLQPLLVAGAPDLLQAAGLRLLSRLWSSSGGRAYEQLRAAVIGFAAPGQQPGLPLRVARGECLRDIAAAEPDKAVELVGLVQECLYDEAPAVQAAGLECVALLCEADVLEFYAAWRVVHAALPRLPEHPAAAAAWVRLLGQGGLDAAVQPTSAAAIVDALWLAAAHEAPQVRGQAYASLGAFQFTTLQDIGALLPLSAFAAALQREGQFQRLVSQQAPASNSGARLQRQAAAQAALKCEDLVRAALAHEHSTRRQQLASVPAAGTAAGMPRSAAGTGPAAAALHKLQTTLPKQLLGGTAANVSDFLQRLPGLPAVAVLHFYAPAADAGKAGVAAARQAAAAYQAVFGEAVKQQAGGTSATGAEDAVVAAVVLVAWMAFMRRWLAAVQAAGRGKAQEEQEGPEHVPAATAAALQVWEAVWQVLASGSSGSPAAGAAAAWAAAALCCCTPQPLSQLVTAVRAALVEASAPNSQQPAAVKRAAMAASGAIAEAVRVTLGAPVLLQLVQDMQQQLRDFGPATGGPLAAAAAATGLGLACASLCSSASGVDISEGSAAVQGGSSLPVAAAQQVNAAMSGLLTSLVDLRPTAGAAIRQAAEADGLRLATAGSPASAPAAQELLPSVLLSLAAALPSAARAVYLPSLLLQLHQHLLASLAKPAAPTETAAICTLLQAVTAAGFHAGSLGSAEVGSSLRCLLSLFSGAPADGRVVGAAAAAAGCLLAAALQQGLTPDAVESAPSAVLQQLLAVPAAAGRLSHAAAAKGGAAGGAAMLLSSAAFESGSQQHKAALAVLEELALRDGDQRSRRYCSSALVTLCSTAKLGSGSGGSESGSVAAGASGRSLAQLPPQGALRPLLESLWEGRWVLLPGDEAASDHVEQQQLTAGDAAAILRCLAAAERMPALNYGSLCRRLMRTHGGGGASSAAGHEVEDAVVAFAAAQGSRQVQQYQLADIVTELLSEHRVDSAPPSSLRCLLQHLPLLLAALPEAQAVSSLQAVCRHIATTSPAQDLLLPLLSATRRLLTSGSCTSPAVLQAAQHLVGECLLPALPDPGLYPLHHGAALAADAAASTGQGSLLQLLSKPQRCWVAALGCLQQLPEQQASALLQQPFLVRHHPLHAAYATTSLVAAGCLEVAALQHPRNLLLTSSGGGVLSPQQQGLVAAFVSRAVATLPAQQQKQWLLDVLDACKACASPEGALLLAASLVASSAAAAVSTHQLACDHISLAGEPHAALDALPFTLPTLIGSPAWQQGGATPLLLQRLAASLSSPQYQPLLRACLLGARHSLAPDMWALLATLL